MSARVCCLGGAVLDLIYDLDRLPGKDGKQNAIAYREQHGGMAANAAVAVSRLGGQSMWCGFIGDDDEGLRILAELTSEGVDVRHAKTAPRTKSSHSIVLTDPAGNRAIILYQSRAIELGVDWLPLDELLAANVVLADNRWVAGACRLLSAAAERGIPGVLDADSAGDAGTRDAVRLASHTIFSSPGLNDLYGAPDPADGLRLASADCPFVAVTLGKSGVMWLERSGSVRSLPAFPTQVVETVGAGDLFHGAFALALIETGDEATALRFASAAAALKCARKGGRRSYPDRPQVDDLLQSPAGSPRTF